MYFIGVIKSGIGIGDGPVKTIRGELVILDSKKYTYPMRAHPKAGRAVNEGLKSYGSEGEFVRRRINFVWWLVLRTNSQLGLPEKEFKKMVRNDKGALRYTGKRIEIKVCDSKITADRWGL